MSSSQSRSPICLLYAVAQPCDQVADLLVVLGKLAPGRWLGDAAPQGVLVDARHRVPLPEQLLGSVVRQQNVEPAVDQGCRKRVERMDDLADGVGDRLARAFSAERRRLGQPVQVFPLHPVQPEGAGHRVEYLGAGVDLTALFQPGVPGDPDAGQERDFLAPQPRSTTAGPRRHAEVTRAELGPARLEELAELRPPPFTRPPRRPVLWFVRDQGLFPSPDLPQSNLVAPTDISAVVLGLKGGAAVRRSRRRGGA